MRVRFAPSPTGYLHIGSARTFIFNWLYARHNGGTMILRLDDTDVDRNSDTSVNSIFDGLKWLDLGWDEYYRQSDRLELHKKMAHQNLRDGKAYRDFTPAASTDEEKTASGEPWLFNATMRDMSKEESDRRAADGEPFVLRFRVPRDPVRDIVFKDLVFGEQKKSTADIEDFALLRSNGMPTYHMASCADDVDLKITHIIRGQDHLSNTFKHILIFEALGATGGKDGTRPRFAHLPLLIAPDGAKLSKRKHGPVVSVTTYRDAGFLAHSYVNFLCLLGWSPKDDREMMSREELIKRFTLEGVNRSNAVVNFSDADPIDPKALWLNGQHMRAMPAEELAAMVRPLLEAAGIQPPDDRQLTVMVDILRARYQSLHDFTGRGRAYFADPMEMEPASLEKLSVAGAREGLRELAARLKASDEFTEPSVEAALRKVAEDKGLKAGVLINGARAALTGQTVGPSAFAIFTCLGRERSIARLEKV